MPAAVRVLVLGLLAGLFVVSGVAWAEARGGTRLALVIGEAAYPGARLPTAAADAGLVATALAQAGFDVTGALDADAQTLRATIASFASKVRDAGADAALCIYVNGYGLQYRGENWLVPPGARIERDDDVPAAAVRLAELTLPLERAPAALRLFLFDLARPTPFAHGGTPLASGLALTEAPVGSVYAFNAAPGTVGRLDVPPYGAYARALAEAVQAPGLSPGTMLRRVRLRVAERTDGAVLPYDDGSSEPGFAFFPGVSTTAAATAPLPGGSTAAAAFSTAIARDTLPGYVEWLAAFARDPLAGRVVGMAAARREALIWSEAVRANTPRAYWTYQRRYPRGPHGGDVRRQLFALHAALEPPPRFEIVPFEGLPPPNPGELAFLGRVDPTFADPDGPSIPTPPPALLPDRRSAFFETLAPPPIVTAGSLPLPLPVGLADGAGRPAGRVEQPAVPGGALVTRLIEGRDGFDLATSGPGGAPRYRVAGTAEHGRRTIGQVSANGATISKVTVGAAADGTLAMRREGPKDLLIDRWETRDGKDGSRVTTMFDGAGGKVATTTVSAGEIVTASAFVTGSQVTPTFVLAAAPDEQGGPVVLAAKGPQAAPNLEAAAADGPRHDLSSAGASETPAAKAPALPSASGLTGEVPKLDLPPAPPTPAFDGAAAPVASAPATPPGNVDQGTGSAEPVMSAPTMPSQARSQAPSPEPAPSPTAKDGVSPPGPSLPAAANAAPAATGIPGPEAPKAETPRPGSKKAEAAVRHAKDRSSALPSEPPLPPPRRTAVPKPPARAVP